MRKALLAKHYHAWFVKLKIVHLKTVFISMLIGASSSTVADPTLLIHGSLNFGDTFYQQQIEREIELENVGPGALRIVDLGLKENVKTEPLLPLELAEGETVTVKIQFLTNHDASISYAMPEIVSHIEQKYYSKPANFSRGIKTEPQANIASKALYHKPIDVRQPFDIEPTKGWLYQDGLLDGDGSLIHTDQVYATASLSAQGDALYIAAKQDNGYRRYKNDQTDVIWAMKFDEAHHQFRLVQTLAEIEADQASELAVHSPDGKFMLVPTDNGAIRIFQHQDDGSLRTLHREATGQTIKKLLFMPDSAELLVIAEEKLMTYMLTPEGTLTLTSSQEQTPLSSDQSQAVHGHAKLNDANTLYQVAQPDRFQASTSDDDWQNQLQVFKRDAQQVSTLQTIDLPVASSEGQYCSDLAVSDEFVYVVHGNGRRNRMHVFKRDAQGQLHLHQEAMRLPYTPSRQCGNTIHEPDKVQPTSAPYAQSFVLTVVENNVYLFDRSAQHLQHFQHQGTANDLMLIKTYEREDIKQLANMRTFLHAAPQQRHYLLGIGGKDYGAAITNDYLAEGAEDDLAGIGGGAADKMILLHIQTDGSLSQVSADALFNPSKVDGLGGISDVVISHDKSQLFVTAKDDNALSVWDINDQGQPIVRQIFSADSDLLPGLQGAAGLALSADGQQLYVVSTSDNSLSLFDRDAQGDWHFRHTYDDADYFNRPQDVIVSSDGQKVYVSNQVPPAVSVFVRKSNGDLQLQTHLSDNTHRQVTPRSIAVSPNGLFLAIGTGNGVLAIHEYGDRGWSLHTSTQLESGVNALAFNPSGRHLYTVTAPAEGRPPYLDQQINTFGITRKGQWQFQGGMRNDQNSGQISVFGGSNIKFSDDGLRMFVAAATEISHHSKSLSAQNGQYFMAYYANPENGDLELLEHHNIFRRADGPVIDGSTAEAGIALGANGKVYNAAHNHLAVYQDYQAPVLNIEVYPSDRRKLRANDRVQFLVTAPGLSDAEREKIFAQLSVDDLIFTDEDTVVEQVQHLDDGIVFTTNPVYIEDWYLQAQLKTGAVYSNLGIPNKDVSSQQVDFTRGLVPQVLLPEEPLRPQQEAVIHIDLSHQFFPISGDRLPVYTKDNFPWHLYDAQLLAVENLSTGYKLTILPDIDETVDGVVSFYLPDSSIHVVGQEAYANYAIPLTSLSVSAQD